MASQLNAEKALRYTAPAICRALLQNVSLAALALVTAVGIGVLPEQALAAAECGAAASTVTCTGNSYATGINYSVGVPPTGMTLNLDNPSMVVQNAGPGVTVSGTATGSVIVNMLNFTSITASNIAVQSSNNGAGGAVIDMGSGTVTGAISGTTFGAVYASTVSGAAQINFSGGSVSNANGTALKAIASSGGATIIMTGGSVTAATGLRADASFGGAGPSSVILSGGTVTSTGNGAVAAAMRGSATTTMTGGLITSGGNGLVATRGFVTDAADALVTMQNGTVQSTGNAVSGILAQITGPGQARVEMTGGSVSASGNNADGIFAQSTHVAGTFNVTVDGGTVTGGAGNGAGIHTSAAAGGTLTIGVGATINAASGVAIRDGDANRDGTDEIGGSAVITTAGTLNGAVVLGNGNDVVNVKGGAINGNITGGGSASLNFDLGSGSFTYGAAYTISGMNSVAMTSGSARIDGALTTNTLTVNGGTLQIAGTATATGGTTVSGGSVLVNGTLNTSTFAVTGGTANIAGTATATGGTSLTNSTLVVDGTLNTSTLNMTGSQLLLNGSATATGGATVTGGSLLVNGSLTGSVAIQSGARLGGSGTVGATTLASGSRITPGNSIGTLTINGAYVQGAGSVYEVELDPTTVTSDLIRVNGLATLATGASLSIVKYTGGAFAAGQRYTILTSTGLTGTFGSVDLPVTAFLNLRNSTDAFNAYLTVVQTRAIADIGTTPNEIQVGNSVDSLPDGNAVQDGVLNQATDEAARGALAQLGGEIYASTKSALINESWLLRSAVNDRLRSAFGAVGAAPMATMNYGFTADLAPSVTSPMPRLVPSDRFAVWGQGYGSWGRIDGGTAANVKRSSGGFVLGADIATFDTLRFGVVAGYSRTNIDVDRRLSSSESDNYHLGLYGGGQWGALGLRLGASYTWHDLSTRRSVVAAGLGTSLRADHDAGTAQVFGELGYRIDLGPVAFEPFAGLAYVNLRSDGINEIGGAAALSGTSDDTSLGYSTLGLRASTSARIQGMDLTLRAALGWRHAFGDVDPKATLAFAGSIPFTITGAPIARNAALVEAGLDVAVGANATLGITYAGQLASDAQDHAFKANLAVRF
jgi:outer membrane autotransporter protein